MTTELRPDSHSLENEKLIVDAYVYLYRFTFKVDGEIQNFYIKENNTVYWQGNRWEGIPLQFDGYEATELTSPKRPTFTCGNPNGVLAPYIRDKSLQRARMTQFKVLYPNILNDLPVYEKRDWIVWNVTSLSRSMVSLEVRSPIDGFNVVAPPRSYRPPQFPAVSLS